MARYAREILTVNGSENLLFGNVLPILNRNEEVARLYTGFRHK
jgi:hypothetical protein